ncbi:MAG: glutamate-cysteine ligase family protein [Gammaproteobacteria bacterium]|nr:MAG: glutamate-cysteine ligase family protein [Gammaproteobacteria bacterium]
MLRLFQGFGIELEYMLVDAATLDVAAQADWLLAEAAGTITGEYSSGPLAWNNELALHVIEFKLAEPSSTLAGVAALFQADIGTANALLARRAMRLMPGGMHPWMDPAGELHLWPHDNREVYAAFDRIFSCKGHGWANLQSMHLNLPFEGEAEFGRLHAAIRFLLPILPGLAASSPVMDGQLTRCADNRLAVYATNCVRIPSVTGSLVPEAVFGIDAYRREVLGRIQGDLVAHDPEGVLDAEWVNARGAIPRFERMAIEIRVLDVQECPMMDLAYASLIVAALRALCAESWADHAALAGWRTEDLARLLRVAIEGAETAEINDGRYLAALGYRGRQASVAQVWGHLADHAAASGQIEAADERAIEHYLRHGSLATRISAALPAEPDRTALQRVYAELCACLAEGRPYAPRIAG